jgi:diguanylate cyclase (GGDEF)-like protein
MTKDDVSGHPDFNGAPEQKLHLSELDRRRTQLVTATVTITVIQLATIVLLPVIYPNTTYWLILLLFFILTLVLSILANYISWREVQQINAQPVRLGKNEPLLQEKFVRDPLTNLFSRYYLEDTLERELHRSLRNHASLGIIMLELDHFKHFTDTYGRAVGEMMLIKLADNLQESVRGSDITCRYHGEKFVLMIGDANRDLTLERAEHIRVKAESIKLKYADQEITGITISSGVSIYPEHGTTMEALLKNADDALDRARSKGCNQVFLYQKNIE